MLSEVAAVTVTEIASPVAASIAAATVGNDAPALSATFFTVVYVATFPDTVLPIEQPAAEVVIWLSLKDTPSATVSWIDCPSAVSVIVSSVAARSVTTAPFASATASAKLS